MILLFLFIMCVCVWLCICECVCGNRIFLALSGPNTTCTDDLILTVKDYVELATFSGRTNREMVQSTLQSLKAAFIKFESDVFFFLD